MDKTCSYWNIFILEWIQRMVISYNIDGDCITLFKCNGDDKQLILCVNDIKGVIDEKFYEELSSLVLMMKDKPKRFKYVKDTLTPWSTLNENLEYYKQDIRKYKLGKLFE